MSEPIDPLTIAFRIPGQWGHPRELAEGLPEGCRCTGESLILADGTEVEFGATRADKQFPSIFRSSCRNPATPAEMAIVNSYTVNVMLVGPGGSLENALAMMRAAAAILHAGGAGVFIDNSGLAHGKEQWLAMLDDGSADALTFAYVAIIGDKHEIVTMGMHVLGQREIVMKKSDADASEDFSPIDVMRYLCESPKPVENGHILADLSGPRYQALVEDSPDDRMKGSRMHNPFGRLRLVSMKDVAEKN